MMVIYVVKLFFNIEIVFAVPAIMNQSIGMQIQRKNPFLVGHNHQVVASVDVKIYFFKQFMMAMLFRNAVMVLGKASITHLMLIRTSVFGAILQMTSVIKETRMKAREKGRRKRLTKRNIRNKKTQRTSKEHTYTLSGYMINSRQVQMTLRSDHNQTL